MTLNRLAKRCRRVRTRTGQLMNVLDVGRKRDPAILFIHGFGGCWQSWESQIDFFRKKGYRVIAPDLNGHGGTSFMPHETVLDYAEDVFDVLKRLGVRTPVHVVAHSYGGPVALTMASLRRRSIASMSFVNSFSKHPLVLKWAARAGAFLYRWGEGQFYHKQLSDKAKVLRTVQDIQLKPLAPGRPHYYDVPRPSEETRKQKGVAQRVIDYVLARHTYVSSKLRDLDAAVFPEASADGMIDFFNAARNFQLVHPLPHAALAMHSRDDRVIPYYNSRFQLKYSFNPPAAWHRIRSFSHVPHREYPDLVNGLILEHVQSAVPPAD